MKSYKISLVKLLAKLNINKSRYNRWSYWPIIIISVDWGEQMYSREKNRYMVFDFVWFLSNMHIIKKDLNERRTRNFIKHRKFNTQPNNRTKQFRAYSTLWIFGTLLCAFPLFRYENEYYLFFQCFCLLFVAIWIENVLTVNRLP